MTRTAIAAAALGAMLMSTAASAGPRTGSRVFSGSHASGTQTVTRQSGSVSRDTSVTRNLEQTGFAGNTRAASTTRTRTETGSTMTGTAIGRGGNSYAIEGETTRNANGRTSSAAVTNAAGETVASRDATVSHQDGTTTRIVARSGPRRH